MFAYRCVECGNTLTEFLKHDVVGSAEFLDLDAWCSDGGSTQVLAARFAEIIGVVSPIVVRAPAPGEIPTAQLIEASHERLYYFVDEAGDPNLFGRQRRVIVGSQGCSHCFMLGALCVEKPATLDQEIVNLRSEILADPSLRDIESLRPARHKTAIQFHASKDHRLVRERVFEVLSRQEVKMFAVVRRKMSLARDVLARAGSGPISFSWQREFDSMVARLFLNRLHQAQEVSILIAERGSSNRDARLSTAVETARNRFEEKWGVVNPHLASVRTARPDAHPGLQVVDYYLWALQRAFERGDFAYFERVKHVFSLVVDVDDRRESLAGRYYGKSDTLSPAKIKPLES